MVCNPGCEADVSGMCGSAVEVLPIPIDDSWIRDSGPVFVRDAAGRVAAVSFRFNAWGERWHPHDNDAALGARIAEYLQMRCYTSSMVLEGGAYLVDGEGTLLTTEQCLLHPNRNPGLTREQIEQELRDYLGVSTVVWLPRPQRRHRSAGHRRPRRRHRALRRAGPRAARGPRRPQPPRVRDRARQPGAAASATDARGRRFEVLPLDPGTEQALAYANHYLANGAVIVPVGASPTTGRAGAGRGRIPGSRGGRCARRGPRVRRRRPALHHPADPRRGRRPGVTTLAHARKSVTHGGRCRSYL